MTEVSIERAQAQGGAQAMAEGLYAQLRRGGGPPLPLRPQDEVMLEPCEAFRFGDGLAGWSIGDGPAVLLAHGWGGRGVQMARLAHAFARRGFRAVFFDAGGHGESARAPLGFDGFMANAVALQHFLGGEPWAWIGHSAGALALMSARRTHGIRAKRYVCLAAPFTPYVPIERLRRSGAPEAALDGVKAMIAAEFGTDWSGLEAGWAWTPAAEARLMAVYDDDDEVAHRQDGAAVLAAWPGADLLRTEGLGHNRILQSDQVIDAVLSFVEGG